MKTVIGLVLFTLAALIFAPARASATTVADCQLLLVALSEQTAATTFYKGDKGVKVELKLQSHIANASNELVGQNTMQALQEMRDYESDVNSAILSGILQAADGAALNVSADGVIACMKQVL